MDKNKKSLLVGWIAGNPKLSILIAFIISFALMPGLANIQFDFTVKSWFGQNNEYIKKFETYIETFGTDESVILVVSRKGEDTIFKPQFLKDIQETTNKIWEFDSIVRVESLANFMTITGSEEDIEVYELLDEKTEFTELEAKEIGRRAMSDELAVGRLVNREGTHTLIMGTLKSSFEEKQDYSKVVKSYRGVLKELEEKGYTVNILGTAYVTDEFKEVAEADFGSIIPLLIFLILVVLVYLYRRVLPVIIPFIVITLTLIATMGICGFFGISLNNLSAMVPTILMAICIADTIHIMTGYLNLDPSPDRHILALQKNIFPTFLTSVTTAIGFFSLVLSDILPIKDFGLLCGIGCLFAWVISILVVTPLLQIFGPDLVLPEKMKTAVGEPKKNKKIVRLISKYPKAIVVLFLLTTVLMVFLAMQNEVNSNPFDYFAKNTRISKDNQAILDTYKGLNALQIVIDSGEDQGIHEPEFLKKLEELQNWIEEKPYTNTTMSFLNHAKRINKAFNNDKQEHYVIPTSREKSAQSFLFYTLNLPNRMDASDMVDMKQRLIKLVVFWDVQSSKKSVEETERIVAKGKSLGLNLFATGQEYLFQRVNEYVVTSYFTSIGISVVLVSILLMIIFKSFYLGLLSLFPNIIPIVFGSGVMAIMGRPIDVGTVIVGSVCFGIAVDDTIHFLTNYKRLKEQNLDFETMLSKIFDQSGKALIFTTVVLVLGFSVFVFADFVPNFNFGVLSAFVLFMALLTDLVFLPALLKIFTKEQIEPPGNN